MNHIIIYPPGHKEGHAEKWVWEIHSKNEIIDCGSADTDEEAWEGASYAFEVE